MSLHTDEQFLAVVAAALGESIALIRRRGFHLEGTTTDDETRPARKRPRRRDDGADDALDLGAYGIDWDADDDSRGLRRSRLIVQRHRGAA